MNELIYNIKMTIWFVIIMSFVLFRYIKLDHESQFHANDFEWLLPGFSISTGAINYQSGNIIYITPNLLNTSGSGCLKDIPVVCSGTGIVSMKCLAEIKEKWYGYYNWAYFKPADLKCR